MPKLFAIAPHTSGIPDTAPLKQGVDYKGWVLADTVGGFGAYLFSGTAPQLAALNALAAVVGICVVTEDASTRWAELDGTIAAGVRTKLNTWLTARGHPNIPAGWTYRQVVTAVYQRLNARFDIGGMDVAD